MLVAAMSFRFIDTPPFIDRELELVAPHPRWVDSLLATCAHPSSKDDPGCQSITRERLTDFIRIAPNGRQPADPSRGMVPSYHFWMRLLPDPAAGAKPLVEIAGGLTLRVGNTYDLETYVGHFGYGVHPPARGKHLAERSVRLLLPLARAHGLKRIWITANPDNRPSRRTCERLGCSLAGVVPVPEGHSLYQRGDRYKCRYWLDL